MNVRSATRTDIVKQLIGLVFFGSSILFLGVSMTLAFFIVDTAGATAPAANTLKVAPVRTDIVILPGKSQQVIMTITNITKSSVVVRPLENDFISGDERGSPALLLDNNTYAPTHSLKRFMKPLPDITLGSGESKELTLDITVPVNAQAGGYFGAVRFAPAVLDGGGQVNLSASVASLILLTVPGDVNESIALTDFNIIQKTKQPIYYNNRDNIDLSLRFENKGNVQVGPAGKVSVSRGKAVVYEVDFNNKNPRDMILPDSARRWDIPLKEISSFGRYTISGTFTSGKANTTVQINKTIWVIPQTAIVAAAVGSLICFFLIAGGWMYIHRHGRASRYHSRSNLRNGFRK